MVCGYSRWASAVLIPTRTAEDLYAGWWQRLSTLGATPPLRAGLVPEDPCGVLGALPRRLWMLSSRVEDHQQRQEGHAMTLPGPQEGLNPAHVQAGESDDHVLAPATPGAEALGDGGAADDEPGSETQANRPLRVGLPLAPLLNSGRFDACRSWKSH